MRHLTIYLALLFSPALLLSQSITAYTDQRGYFYIFDNGITHEMEYQAPLSFKVGGACIAYLDYNENFKAYYNGEVQTIYNGPVNSYAVTHSLMFYVIAGQLKVFDRGETKNLTPNTGPYQVGDSLIAFCDNLYNTFNVYYNHEVKQLEGTLLTNPLIDFKASNNTVAYIANNRDFKVFWQGNTYKVFTLSPGAGLDYQTGSDIVAFQAGPGGTGLSVFYKGKVSNLTTLPILSYKTCDDMVAYEDQNGLHAFSNGRNYDISTATDLTWAASDSVLVYYFPGYFRVFNRGKTTDLCNYKPSEFVLDNNTVAWINQQGGLEAFFKDDTYELSGFERVLFKLEGNALWFKGQTSPNKVFLCGKTY